MTLRATSIAGLSNAHALTRCRRLLLLTALVVAATLRTTPALAHPGGHDLAQGASLTLWTDPTTGQALPGTMLYVANGQLRVEDVAGVIHTWPLADLSPQDRERANVFRARVEALNLGTPMAPTAVPERRLEIRSTPSSAWPGAIVGLSAVLWLAAAWTRQRRVTRGPLAATLALLAIACSGSGSSGTASTTTPSSTIPSGTAAGSRADVASYFAFFPSHVRTRVDATTLYVESDGLADHTLMVGIRSWQQQIPLPAAYTGSNAWTIPRTPVLAAQPVSARTGLFRGAIALAVNGIPVFNALNNRGDDAFLAGELDDFGGHAGRADDYHYHTAPLFLSTTVGATNPIAVALDGFALYGSLEPDGSAMRPLDEYNGHVDSGLGYHYHGTLTYPYINGGMKGVVRVSDQVEPQPSLVPVRPALTPLTGAVVTRHVTTGTNSWSLEYQIAGRTYRVDYRIEGTRVTFVFTDPNGTSRTEVYTRA
ncbi:MAG: YHYH protein [Vicinamibacterales bacterium]